MAVKQASARPVFATIESFLAEVSGNIKSAEAHTEAGGYMGPTTQPVKNVDDHTQAATTGARSAENTADVKEEIGKPSVDSTPEATAKKAQAKAAGGPGTEDQYQIGLTVSPTGEDVPGTKATKDDKGYKEKTTHPANTENSELNGGKYAADLEQQSLEKLAGILQELGNGICADLVNAGVDVKQASDAATPAAPAVQPNSNGKQAAAIDPNLAQQVGWEMAGIINGSLDKQAADVMVVNTISEIIKTAEDDADRTADYLTKYYAHKQAQAKAGEHHDSGGGAPDPSGGGGGDPGLAAALGGGGAPPDPSAGGGAPPDPSGGGGSSKLQALLQALGITEDQLADAIMSEEQGGGAGGAGGAPGMDPSGGMGGAMGGGGAPGADPSGGGMGGTPPGAAAAMAGAGPGGPSGAAGPMPGASGLQVSAADKSAADQAAKMAAEYIKEVVSRSRAKKAQAK